METVMITAQDLQEQFRLTPDVVRYGAHSLLNSLADRFFSDFDRCTAYVWRPNEKEPGSPWHVRVSEVLAGADAGRARTARIDLDEHAARLMNEIRAAEVEMTSGTYPNRETWLGVPVGRAREIILSGKRLF